MRFSLVALALLLPAVGAAQTTVYTNDFESNSTGWSGAGTRQSTAGFSAFGFGAMHLKNDGGTASILSLSGLATHSSMTLTFDLAMWDSIDYGSDMFIISVNGTDLFNGTFGNYFTPSGNCDGPGTALTPSFTGQNTPDYGYNFQRDCARHVTYTFNHSAATAAFSFSYPNTQNAPDESFGLDNFVIQTDASVVTPPSTVPEPSTYALLGAGLAAIFVARRKRAA